MRSSLLGATLKRVDPLYLYLCSYILTYYVTIALRARASFLETSGIHEIEYTRYLSNKTARTVYGNYNLSLNPRH